MSVHLGFRATFPGQTEGVSYPRLPEVATASVSLFRVISGQIWVKWVAFWVYIVCACVWAYQFCGGDCFEEFLSLLKLPVGHLLLENGCAFDADVVHCALNDGWFFLCGLLSVCR